MKIYEVEERTPLVAPLLNIWEEIWYSKLWNQGSYRQRAKPAGCQFLSAHGVYNIQADGLRRGRGPLSAFVYEAQLKIL